jgi:hypothetical protein
MYIIVAAGANGHAELDGCWKRKSLEARGGIEPPMEALQASALPLGHRASLKETV